MSLFGKIVGGTVGFVVGGPVGAAAGVAIGGSKPATAAGNAVAGAATSAVKYTEEVVEGVGKVIVSGGVVIIDAVSNVAQAVLNVAEGLIAFRPLRSAERQIAQSVFQGSVPLDRVVLSTLIGAGHRPFTIPGSMIMSAASSIPGIGPLLAVDYLLQNLQHKYVIFIGGAGYNNALNMGRDTGRKGQTLIHELTHVWQGHNQAFQWGYVLNSAWNQCTCGAKAAYQVTAGGQWRDYQAEQQAVLVEEWYVKQYGMTAYPQRPKHGGPGFNDTSHLVVVDDPLARALNAYMDCNIRPGKPQATTIIPASGTPSTRSAPGLIGIGQAMTPLRLG